MGTREKDGEGIQQFQQHQSWDEQVCYSYTFAPLIINFMDKNEILISLAAA